MTLVTSNSFLNLDYSQIIREGQRLYIHHAPIVTTAASTSTTSSVTRADGTTITTSETTLIGACSTEFHWTKESSLSSSNNTVCNVGEGDITHLDNIDSFVALIKQKLSAEATGDGVRLVLADASTIFEGDENKQEFTVMHLVCCHETIGCNL